MAFDVMVLVAGDPPPSPAVSKGDVVEVVAFSGVSEPWGLKTVAPKWVRETVTSVPGNTHQESDDEMRQFLDGLASGFDYSAIPGAAVGFQRYRTAANPELQGNLNAASKAFVRQGLIDGTGGTLVSEDANSFDIDVLDTFMKSPEDGLPEFAVITNSLSYRRIAFPSGIINDALLVVPDGQPATMTHPWVSMQGLLSDKLRGPVP